MVLVARWSAIVWLAGAMFAAAQSAEDTYLAILDQVHEADAFTNAERWRDAIQKYVEAQKSLKSLQNAHPGWNERVVKFRLDDLTGKIDALTKKVPSNTPAPTANVAAVTNTGSLPAAPAISAAAPAAQEEVHRLTMQNALLEAKLREALSVQPASTDPREFAKATERIRALEKENDLLRITVEQQKPETAQPTQPPPNDADRRLLAETKQKLDEQIQLVATLHRQREGFEKEIADLKNRLAAVPPPVAAPATPSVPPEMQAQLMALAQTNKMLQAQLILAENRVVEVMRQYSSAPKEIPAAPAADAAARKELEQQIESLRSRLAVYEAQKVPFSAQELALMKSGVPKVPPPPATGEVPIRPKRINEPPPGTSGLVEEARRAIEAGRLDEAEKKYQQVLERDANNVFALASLASVQLDLQRDADAERHLRHALTQDSQDANATYLLGSLKLRQEKYDEAIEALSVATKVNPERAEAHFFLGKALVYKGQRQPAETALRKAIQLRTGWGEPHYALAVLYATQQPVYKELAQWHYQRALAGGAARNQELEKYLENLTAAK